jgi:hypothetical protein
MIYQVNYNRGHNTCVCATEYVDAKTYDEAYRLGMGRAVYPEKVFDVFPIHED